MRGSTVSKVAALMVLGLLLLAAPSEAAFPGTNGLLAFDACPRGPSGFCSGSPAVETMAADGSGRTTVRAGREPAWSPDGAQIAFTQGGIHTMTSAGTIVTDCPCNFETGTVPFITGSSFDRPAWSPDGTRLAFRRNDYTHDEDAYSVAVGPPGGPLQDSFYAAGEGIDWSPDGAWIYFGDGSLAAWSPGGSYRTVVADGNFLSWPSTSPDASRIALTRDPYSSPFERAIYVVQTNGTGLTRLSLPAPATDYNPAWSPDGTKIAFVSERDGNPELYLMNADGSNQTRLTNTPTVNEDHPDWQPIPVNGFPRPKAATPMYVSLVPAYTPCSTPNRVHAAPLSYSSCSPPQQSSTHLTVGTADANGLVAGSSGYARLTVVPGDVSLAVNITDVRNRNFLNDYAGELRMQALVRATDKQNTPHPGGPGPATIQDLTFGPSIPCAATASTTIGSTCSLSTTVNALIPGLVVAGARSNWEFGRVALYDGGTDGDGDTQGDNTLFATQGLFVP
jgi:Tol biopolymer transport system component